MKSRNQFGEEEMKYIKSKFVSTTKEKKLTNKIYAKN